MFKQSRRKILISIMAILIFLFLGILIIIYASSFHDVADENYEMLERYAELYSLTEETEDFGDLSDADAPSGTEAPGYETPTGDPSQPDNLPDSDIPDSPPEGNDPPPESTPTFQLSTFYSVAISDDGEILRTENTNISYENEELENIAAEIIQSSKDKGIHGNLIYYTMEKNGYTLVAFVDNTIISESMSTLFRYTLIYGGAAIILIFFLSIFLAKKIVDPLEESYQSQKQFISDAGHELKTPIAVINTSAELLSRELGENTWLANIQYENDHMGALVTQMLELARTENTVPPMERLDFSRLAAGEALPFESIAFEKGLRLVCRITEDIQVQGNAAQLRQLISILLDNALHHCTVNGEIGFSLCAERNTASLSVANDGEEIPPESRDKIFERFYRGDSARNSEDKRYGLGLAIARAIVSAHHGNIEVLCHDGKVEFTVTIPVLK